MKLKHNNNQNPTLSDRINDICTRRLVNSEYQRGFMEGYHAAASEFSKAIELMVNKFNQIEPSRSTDWIKEIAIGGENARL